MEKVLFIVVKRRTTWNSDCNYSYCNFASGTKNSALFVKNMLVDAGREAELVEVVDNNDIDREVTRYNPTHVVIEALWVVPEKFEVLIKLHPKIKWIIRVHSDFTFLANEGSATDWIKGYLKYPQVTVSFNLQRTNEYFGKLLGVDFLYLPNYYPLQKKKEPLKPETPEMHIACLGAVRPMKNIYIQAIAAMLFADKIGKTLFFHINAYRIEQAGNSTLKNIRALFVGSKHQLVEHEWMEAEELNDLCKSMDIGMQVSLSETFNLVAAQFASLSKPLVVSPEIFWACRSSQACPTIVSSIVDTLKYVWNFRRILYFFDCNKDSLADYNKDSKKIWLKALKKV